MGCVWEVCVRVVSVGGRVWGVCEVCVGLVLCMCVCGTFVRGVREMWGRCVGRVWGVCAA